MGYQALARQYRPQDFTELVGQEHVSQALINGLEQDRIHHAFLFTGTRGVGKTTLARILAKSLNCEKGVTGSPCGVCTACNEITDGRFIDLIEVDAASRTGVDDTRELLENVQYAPTSGRYKIYLIDEVHMFSKSSFNALLKTLEEPPPHVKFILATTEPKKLPVTILSRCLQFNLKRLSLKQISGQLVKLLGLQKIDYDNTAIELIARAADGSMRDGLSLLDQSIAFGAGTVKDNDVKIMLGTMDQNRVVGLLNSIINKEASQLTDELQQVFMMAPDYSRFLNDMALLLHEVSLFQILNSYVESSQFERQAITSIAESTSAEQIQLFYQIVIKGQNEINNAPDSKIGFEMTVIRLFAFKIGRPQSAQLSQKKTKIFVEKTNQSQEIKKETKHESTSTAVSEQKLSEPVVKSIFQQDISEQAPQEVVSKQLLQFSLSEVNNGNWQNIFNQLLLKGTARELARNTHVISNENNCLVLAIDKKAETFMTQKACDRFQNAIEVLINEPISIKLQAQDDIETTLARVQQNEQEASVETTKKKVSENPFVQHIQNNFDAEVIQIKKGEDFI